LKLVWRSAHFIVMTFPTKSKRLGHLRLGLYFFSSRNV
jgi:hypothetical protein